MSTLHKEVLPDNLKGEVVERAEQYLADRCDQISSP